MDLFVSSIDYSVAESDIRECFAQYGPVWEFRMPKAADGGPGHRGFCFVRMPNVSAVAAMAELDHQVIGGRMIRVREAQPRTGVVRVPEVQS